VVGKWHKRVGEAVKADEPVVVLETDKVTIDVQAPAGGALQTISMPEGSKVRIGEILGTIDPGAAGTQPSPSGEGARRAGEGGSAASGNGKVTPVARAVAADKGIDPSKLPGTGSGGRVTKDDVLKANVPVPSPSAPHLPTSPAQQLRSTPGAREERVTMSPLRRRVAERLLQAQSTAAILTTFNEVDMSAVIDLRKKYQERYEKKHGVKLGLMSFFVKAAVNALQQFPAVNASLEGDEVVFHHYYDIGVAVSGSRGLVVPVVRAADELSMAELEKTIADFGVRARNDKLTLPELQGGTFTLSNGGIFGSMLSTPILNPPQTGILGMHNIVERPVARDGQVVIRPVMYLALSYDHRLIDGREAVQFLVRIKDCIEDPERILLDI
jgi:2-oxoglutarate dehydrogenase E2 component (dihydrolipoamide succinyltransferase)